MSYSTKSSKLSLARTNVSRISAKTLKIGSLSLSRDKVELKSQCPECDSRVSVVVSGKVRDTLDLDGKRHFCEAEDRRRHEEEYVIRLLKLIDDCNRIEFSSFQVELSIP